MQKLENRLALRFTLIAKKKYGSYEALIRRHLWNILTITIENKIWVRENKCLDDYWTKKKQRILRNAVLAWEKSVINEVREYLTRRVEETNGRWLYCVCKKAKRLTLTA